MTATTKRIVDAARRDAIIEQNQKHYFDAVVDAWDAIPLQPPITWPHIHACRKALTAATVALDAIETQMGSERRK
jgi:hypothetical protein